ncbi:MAG: TonB-dependent receptor [Parvibaculum sp.]|uniref:TonB-dependent receptor n=1 Tax=Parvibaculum sp. TaxID=2024848 RepID=UPI0025F5D5E1|nr:TonB-dependent receptor [Parvibaculum sp.]MCE9650476.1 TonB-dependent receptor [Parvibaculum sp.]
MIFRSSLLSSAAIGALLFGLAISNVATALAADASSADAAKTDASKKQTSEKDASEGDNARTEAARTDASKSDASKIETIVVTAEKRSESLQNVSLAISALTGDRLEQLGANKFEDMALSAPGVAFLSNGGAYDKVVMRGITAGNVAEAQTPATGFYLDDVPLSSNFTSGGSDLRLFDVNRMEVLRGPQGTLYGGGAMGGAIRIITNQPDATAYEAKGEVTGADIPNRAGEYDLNGMINIPLVKDRLALRAVAVFHNQNGYVSDPNAGKSGVNDNEVSGGRVALKWDMSPDLSATMTGIFQRSHYDGVGFVDTDANKQPLQGDLTQQRNYAEPSTAVTKVGNLTINYEMPWATLVSSSSYADNTTDVYTDGSHNIGALFPGSPADLSVLDDSEESYVEEVRLVSTSFDPIKWIIGGYYKHGDLVAFQKETLDPSSPFAFAPPLSYYTRSRSETYAAFGELTYRFAPRWDVTAGLRYTSVPTNFQQNIWGSLLLIPTPSAAIASSTTSTSSDLTPKFEITYRPTDEALIYVEAAKGFRPGSPNADLPPGILSLPSPDPLKPDQLWNYELGGKSSWFDGRLVANGAVYLIRWEDMQVVGFRADGLPYFANAGNADSKGVELEIQARPADAWLFTLSGAYTDAHFTKDTPSLGVVDGERLATVPRLSGTVAVDYSWPLTDTAAGFAHFDVRYESDKTVGYDAKAAGIKTDPYAIGNFRVGADLDGGVEAAIFVDNIWNERAQLAINTSDMPYRLRVLVAQPRTVGLTVSKSF